MKLLKGVRDEVSERVRGFFDEFIVLKLELSLQIYLNQKIIANVFEVEIILIFEKSIAVTKYNLHVYRADNERHIESEVNGNKISDEKQTHHNNLPLFSTYFVDFIRGMFKYMGCSSIVFVYALALIDRIQQSHQDFYMTCRNAHRLILTAVLVATKFYDDYYFKNTYYAKLGGITTQLLNDMEIEFLNFLNFNCYIGDLTLKSYLQRLDIFAQLNTQNSI